MLETSMQTSLANSIKRAKEKMEKYQNKSFTTSKEKILALHHQDQLLQNDQYIKSSQLYSEKYNKSIHQNQINRSDKKAFAFAMKNLQEKIIILEKQKSERDKELYKIKKRMESEGPSKEKQASQINKLIGTLKQKEFQISTLKTKNMELSQLNEKLKIELHSSLGKKVKQESNKNQFSKFNTLDEQKNKYDLLMLRLKEVEDKQTKMYQKQRKEQYQKSQLDQKIAYEEMIVQLNQQRRQLKEKEEQLKEKEAERSRQISILKQQLQKEKKINLRWIRFHQEELQRQDQEQVQKQNKSYEVNKQNTPYEANKQNKRNSQVKIKPLHQNKYLDKIRQQLMAQQQKNHDLLKIITKNKTQIQKAIRSNKELTQKYQQLKLTSKEIIDQINFEVNSPSNHLKYLILKIFKIENDQLSRLRSISHTSKKMRISDRSSSQKRGKMNKMLKMEDLNSSSKKSIQRSASKSKKKRYRAQSYGDEIEKSEKKHNLFMMEDKDSQIIQQQITELEKEVIKLKKTHRNYLMKANDIGPDHKEQIDTIINQYNEKKQKLDQLKKNIDLRRKSFKG